MFYQQKEENIWDVRTFVWSSQQPSHTPFWVYVKGTFREPSPAHNHHPGPPVVEPLISHPPKYATLFHNVYLDQSSCLHICSLKVKLKRTNGAFLEFLCMLKHKKEKQYALLKQHFNLG